jgi:hypothetical protein
MLWHGKDRTKYLWHGFFLSTARNGSCQKNEVLLMFVGSVPRGVVNQLLNVAAIQKNDRVFVCCSGSFRVDLAIKEHHSTVSVSGNDVSLLSCVVGKILTGGELSFEFINELAFIEEILKDRDKFARAASISIALELSKYNKKTLYGKKHVDYFINHFRETLDSAVVKVKRTYGEASIDDFYIGDFQAQALRAAEVDGFVVAFPPTYKGGYERMYKRVDENTQWSEPDYGIWDPESMERWLDELRERDTRHCIFVDRQLEGLKPMAKFERPRSHPIYLYGHGAKGSSLRVQVPRSKPFKYEPIDPSELCKISEVRLAEIRNDHFNFLRNKYLAKGIMFVDGMFNYLVLIDGRVAGGFSLSRMNTGDRNRLYLLSDFSIRRERRLAKLIALLAATRLAVRHGELKMLLRIQAVVTSVFTDRPVSMKYRGIYKLIARKPGFLQYERAVTEDDPQEVYTQWWNKYGSKN